MFDFGFKDSEKVFQIYDLSETLASKYWQKAALYDLFKNGNNDCEDTEIEEAKYCN